MSFGSGYNGGHTRMGTKVILNVYDLSPGNEFLYPIGLGLHHSGVEISGSEYSFGGGGGIFENTPKEANGAKYRESIDMGSFDGGSSELQRALSDLRDNDFGPNSYNLIRRNCNHFANALCWALLRKTIPGHVNRLADFGNCCSCLLPKDMLESAPVNGSDSGSGSGFQMQGGSAARARETNAQSQHTPSFSGSGRALGSEENNNSNQQSSSFGGLKNVGNIVSSMTMTRKKEVRGDDLTDRREKARKAALARFEQNSNSNNNNSGSSSSSYNNQSSDDDGLKRS